MASMKSPDGSKGNATNSANAKIIKIIIFVCIILVLVIIGIVTINRNRDKKQELLMKSVYNSFLSDFNDYVKSLNVHEINIDASFKLEESTQEGDILNFSCYPRYISDDLSKYADIEKDSGEAKELFNLFERINKEKNARRFFTYEIDNKTVNINLEGSGGSSFDFIIYDGNLHEYHFYSNDNYEKLEIDNTIVFSRGEAEDPKSSSFTESHDATLEYDSGSVLVFVSEDAMSRYMSAIKNDNQGIIEEMKNNGKVGWTENGTKCNILKKGFGKYQVKLLDGLHEGSTVWVIHESLKEK